MAWPTALLAVPPGAALRPTRTAAGRRALQVALLVGGLFVLALLCGERAHAADDIRPVTTKSTRTSVPSVPSVPSVASVPPVTSVTSVTASTSVAPVALPGRAHVHTVRQVLEDEVVQPVGDLVTSVTGELAEAPAKPPSLPTLPALPAPPTLPNLPDLPDLPTLPGLPALPDLPGVPDLPTPPTPTNPTTPAPTVPTIPVTPTAPTLPPPVAASQAPSVHSVAVATSGRAGETAVGERLIAGPRVPAVTANPAGDHVDPSHVGRQRTASGVQVPGRRAPAGEPGGALSGKSGVDGGTSRHGDAQAVTPGHRAPLRLVPGTAAGGAAALLRDRHVDVPVSPA
ncbi:hypothetical protein ABZT03_29075 [Streptomyces sp. NPDC005574]|uniref:hypothetical protein n=1 Tax=Streptomyces sp. NPDC005574 TaxID=3156891 RepID=UPI0033BF55D1